ncbi:hypothetical protein Tco_0072462 [Tanacetum coccineum]
MRSKTSKRHEQGLVVQNDPGIILPATYIFYFGELLTIPCAKLYKRRRRKSESRKNKKGAKDCEYWKIPNSYDDDETIPIENHTLFKPSRNPITSQSYGDEHLTLVPTSGIENELFYVDNDHFKERSSGSTTTHVDFSQYDSFIFDLSNDQFPPADRSDFNHEEFADELTHIMSLPNLECFKFKIEPDPGDLTSIDLGIRKNVSTTNVNVPLEDDQSSLFAYVVWIFLAFLTYPVVPPYLLSTRNEDTIFDPGISIYHSFMPDVSHRSGTFMKFNDFPDCEDSHARSIHKSFTSSASFWESSIQI